MKRAFRFGITLFPVASERRSWIDQVLQAEAVGFSVLTVTDHFGNSGGIFASLMAAYDAAPSMRVGTLVLNSDFWPPSLLAREVITADVLTNGGFELGLGAGWSEPDYRAIGIERTLPGLRIDRLEESLHILDQAFSGRRVAFQGTHYSVDGGAPWPKPDQEHIPILIGGGSQRILKLAARRADIVSIHRNLQQGSAASWALEKPDATTERVGWIREAAGERYPHLELHCMLQRVVVTDRRRSVALEVGKPNGLSVDAVLNSPSYLIGTTDEMVEDLIARRAKWDISYLTLVTAKEIEALIPVVARLAGA